MTITFDTNKAAANVRKHGVRFSDVEQVLYDPRALTREDIAAVGEERFVSIGADATGRILVVVYTYRDDEVRLISARLATARERAAYEG